MSRIYLPTLLAAAVSFQAAALVRALAEDAPKAPAEAPVPVPVPFTAPAAPAPASDAATTKAPGFTIEGWGKVTDPGGDCGVTLQGKVLKITVPPTGPHDLAPEIGVTNAPRVLQAVEGDFSIRVKVGGGYQPGGETTSNERVAYNGAALIVMADPENVITLARAVMQRGALEPTPYANFEIRSQGRLLDMGSAATKPLTVDGPLWLRLERRGSQVTGAVSADGEKWDALEPKEIPGTWPKTLHTGVAGISTSAKAFEPAFSELRLEK
ncbi:MAG: hypothetical protein JWM59_4558 [Verrucomicrobiales bacterium]|nr:hypothetical protein [Verrucomicrobiales bacterium]